MAIECHPSLLASGDATIAWIATHLRLSYLTPVVAAISNIGTSGPILFTMALAYWLWNKHHAKYLGYGVFGALLLNLAIKESIKECRPPRLYRLEEIPDYSFSFPSGHAQVSTVLWLGLAYYFRKKPLLSILFFLIGVGISLSRPYLGAHYPHDIAVGFLLGLGVLITTLIFEKKAWRLPFATGWQALFLGLFVTLYAFLFYQPSTALAFGTAGLFGFWLGCQLEAKYVHFEQPYYLSSLLKRALIGVIGVLLLRNGISAIGIEGMQIKFVQAFLLGFWVSYGAPLLYKLRN